MKTLILSLLMAISLPHSFSHNYKLTAKLVVYSGDCTSYSSVPGINGEWNKGKVISKGRGRVVISYETNTVTAYYNDKVICGGICSSALNQITGAEDFIWSTNNYGDQPTWFKAFRFIGENRFLIQANTVPARQYEIENYKVDSVE